MANKSISIKMLDAFKIPWVLIGDLDCYLDVVGKVIDYLKDDELIDLYKELKEIFGAAPLDPKKLGDRMKGITSNFDAQQLVALLDGFRQGVKEIMRS